MSTRATRRVSISANLLTAAISIFFVLCFCLASDPSGGISLWVLSPIIASLLLISCFLVFSVPGTVGLVSKIRLLSIVSLTYFGLFLLSFGALPQLSFFSKIAIAGTARAYELVSGKSPLQWRMDSENVADMILNKLKDGDGTQLDLSDLQTPVAWKELCIFGPHSTNMDSVAALGFQWKIESYSLIRFDEKINTLVFSDPSETTVFYLELSRDRIDFTNLSGTCIPKAKARFVRVKTDSGMAPFHILQ